MSRWIILMLISTGLFILLDYTWRVTSISLRKILPIVLPFWLVVLVVIWYWMD